MEMATIRFEQDYGVGSIVLMNPPQNRIGSRFAEDLRVAVHEASLSDSRVLVIRSEGPNFCLGGNVPEWVGKSADWFRTFIAECNSSFYAIEALRIPTVAVVHGGAIGGGMELALACDFLVAAENARFFAIEIRGGNIPLAGGLQRLAERVGRTRALKLALLGEPFSGAVAGDLGVATLVVPETDLDEASRKLVDQLANGPTKAYAAARTMLKAWSAGGVAGADAMMLDVAIDLFKTEDTTNGMLAGAKAIEAGGERPPMTFLGR
jgi:enoyl-CoA hydratase/carnithine racemase